jgi:hypothetical protein
VIKQHPTGTLCHTMHNILNLLSWNFHLHTYTKYQNLPIPTYKKIKVVVSLSARMTVNFKTSRKFQAGLLSEKFPNCTLETKNARPFQRNQKYFPIRNGLAFMHSFCFLQFGNRQMKQVSEKNRLKKYDVPIFFM